MFASASSILELFEKKQLLEIPLFQRQYVWNREHHWEPLWEDIARKLTAFSEGDDEGPVHFLGAMVLDQKLTPTTSIERRQVIDGQQRLTTLQIILAAFRDFCAENGSTANADEFGDYTKNRVKQGPEWDSWKYKVWPTLRDREQFCAVMDSQSRQKLEAIYPLVRKPRSSKWLPRPRMVEGYCFFYDKLRSFFLGDNGEPPVVAASQPLDKRLDHAVRALKGGLQVVVIDLGDGDDAQVIFETLNARGEPLLPADLLRNYIFLRAARAGSSQEQLYNQYWKGFDEPLWREPVRQGRLVRPRGDIFLQHYLSSRRFTDVPISHLFSEYKHWIVKLNPFPTIESELAALSISREVYHRIILSPHDSALGRMYRFLDTFDVGTVTPLLMVIVESNPPDSELKSMLSILESYLIRRTVCLLSTNGYNRIFLSIAAALKRDGANVSNLLSRLDALAGDSSIWPSDEVFGTAFKIVGYNSLPNQRLKYILNEIDGSLYTAKAERITIHSDLTIEHVMPQKWRANWPLSDGTFILVDQAVPPTPGDLPSSGRRNAKDPAFSSAVELRNSVVQTIGNLTLLTQPLNSAVSNGPWSTKRLEMAKHTRLAINYAIVAEESWNELRISARANRLLESAFRLWPRPTPSST